VSVQGESIPLADTEFGVPRSLARDVGAALTRPGIIEAVKGADFPATDRTVDLQIFNLSNELGAHGKLIETARGVAFRLRPSSPRCGPGLPNPSGGCGNLTSP
jgi:two-component system phosphate regulon response regulator PhoB